MVKMRGGKVSDTNSNSTKDVDQQKQDAKSTKKKQHISKQIVEEEEESEHESEQESEEEETEEHEEDEEYEEEEECEDEEEEEGEDEEEEEGEDEEEDDEQIDKKVKSKASMDKKRKVPVKNAPTEKKTKVKKEKGKPIEKSKAHKSRKIVVKKEVKEKNTIDDDSDSDSDSEVEVVGKPFKTMCRPKSLFSLAKKFTPDQVNSINDIGFGGLLSLSMSRVETPILHWLVDNFDHGSWVQNIRDGKEYVVTAHDVYDMFCLPKNVGKDVHETVRAKKKRKGKKDDVPDEDYMLKCKWRRRYGVPDTKAIPLHLLEEEMMGLKHGGDEFKRLFVAFSFSSFLAPTANRTLDWRILKSLEKIDEIKSLDWCQYVLDRLCEAVKKYKKREQDCFSGCVLLLELLYFHRLKFRDVAESSTIPLIQHWTDEKVRKRIKLELEAKSLGMGVLDKETYPVSKHGKFVDGQIVLDESKNVESNRIIKFMLNENAPTDDDLKLVANDEAHFISLKMKRDIECVTSSYSSRIEDLEKANARSYSLTPSTQTQQFFEDPNVLKVFDEIFAGIQSFKDIRLSQPENAKEPNVERIIQDVITDVDASYSTGDIFQRILVNGRAKCSLELGATGQEVVLVSPFMKSNKSLMKSLPRLQLEIADFCLINFEESSLKSLDVVWFDTVHSIPCDEMYSLAHDQFVYQSIVEHWALLLNENEKEGCNKPRRFFFGVEQSYKLNKCVAKEDDSQEFSELQNCWKEWIHEQHADFDFSGVKLIFVPILDDSHYHILVCNLEKGCMQLLDNLTHTQGDLEDIKITSDCTAVALSAFFQPILGTDIAAEISAYDMEVIDFGWRNKGKEGAPGNDCAIYCMMNMLLFDGSLFQYDEIKKAKHRTLLRAQICSILVLCDANQKRQDMLQQLEVFNSQRPQLQKEFAIKRKKREKEANEEKEKKAKEEKANNAKRERRSKLVHDEVANNKKKAKHH